MAITDKEFAAANARGRKPGCGPRPTPWRPGTTGSADGRGASSAPGLEVAFPRSDAQGLEAATPEDLAEIAIDPPGFGLHFPRLDADLYLAGACWKACSARRSWAASRMGQAGGKARTPAKQAAARANGRRGGRPHKVA